MKVIIIGATGTVGRFLVAQVLSLGHQVTAFTRHPEKLGPPNEKLRVVKGDVLDPASVERAMAGHEAVLCALGAPLMNRAGLRAKGTGNIVRAMTASAVRRLVCLSALGAGDSRAILPARYRYFLIPLFMRHLYRDHELQEDIVRGSQLDWVIVRPGAFSKGGRAGSYRHGFTAAERSLRFKISPADVAHFMLAQLTDDGYLGQTPALST